MSKALLTFSNIRPGRDAADLFHSLRGPLSEWGVRASVKKHAYQVGQEDVIAHTLRRSFTKNLLDVGTSLQFYWATRVLILLGFTISLTDEI